MLKPSDVLKSPKRLPDETLDEYRDRRKLEQATIDRWLKGRPSKRKDTQ
jgi:hypothetical protein